MVEQWPLVGRAEELALITRAVTARELGSGIVIGGLAGVGKTRLSDEAVDAATALGHRCHRVTATSSLREVPLAAFADIGLRYTADPLQQIRELIARLTSGPGQSVIVAVDDAHLLDDRSAFVIHELVVRRLTNVVVTVRTGEPVPDAITALWKDHDVPRLELQPLSQDETERLLEQTLGGHIESMSVRRLHTLSDGNVLLLRQLIADELDAGRLRRLAGVWVWSGEFTVTRSLADMVRRHMTDLPDDVAYTVDLLAVAEPLSSDVLGRLVGGDTLERAEMRGAITSETTKAGPITIKLAHPLQGDVRRADLGRTRRRQLAGIVANELAQDRADPSLVLRRAVLALDSDQPAEPELLSSATRAAMVLFDVALAVRFASAALEVEHSLQHAYPHVMALVIAGEGQAAEDVFVSRAAHPGDPEFVQWPILRAANLIWMLAKPAAAAEVLDAVTPQATTPTARAELVAVRACVCAVRADPETAVSHANTALASGTLSDFYTLIATAAMVMSLGAIGRIDEATRYAQRGYERAAASWQTAHLQFWLAAIHARTCRAAGRMDLCAAEAARFAEIARDVPALTHVQAVFLRGHSALAVGRLRAAIVELLDCLAATSTHPSGSSGLNPACLIWLTEARAVAGDIDSARTTLGLFNDVRPAEYAFMESGVSLAAAWIEAVDGDVDHAIRLATDTAGTARSRGQFAYEVAALQAATQFGGTGTADRLRELTSVVQGPRAATAARHADAFGRRDGAELLAAAREYESMGDTVAAADTAAQAGAAFSAHDKRGSALMAFETARRLAHECGCGPTPALRRTKTVPFTSRQREIIALVADGLSNTDIADRLTMSVRSVEGHLYRAAQRAGVSSRGELVAIHRGFHNTPRRDGPDEKA